MTMMMMDGSQSCVSSTLTVLLLRFRIVWRAAKSSYICLTNCAMHTTIT